METGVGTKVVGRGRSRGRVRGQMPIAKMSSFNLTKHEQGYMFPPPFRFSFKLLGLKTAAGIYSEIKWKLQNASLRPPCFLFPARNPPDLADKSIPRLSEKSTAI